MKVIEKGADRTAGAHIYVDGRLHALEEYGQYIDAHDRAICCYVAVEEGDRIRVDGRFSGMVCQTSSSACLGLMQDRTDPCRRLRRVGRRGLPQGELVCWQVCASAEEEARFRDILVSDARRCH